MSRARRILVELDELFGQLLFKGIAKDETISSYVYRRGYIGRVWLIDAWFGDGHCKQEYESKRSTFK